MSIQVVQVIPVIDYSVRGLCTKPYPGHKKGCPNFNHKNGCPPGVKKFDEEYDLSKPVYAIVNSFDLAAHVEKMRIDHPKWSHRQLVCCLYWQRRARKQLFEGIKLFMREHRHYAVEPCPEAMGVEITKTLQAAGIYLEWPPKTVAYQVALAAIKTAKSQARPDSLKYKYGEVVK